MPSDFRFQISDFRSRSRYEWQIADVRFEDMADGRWKIAGCRLQVADHVRYAFGVMVAMAPGLAASRWVDIYRWGHIEALDYALVHYLAESHFARFIPIEISPSISLHLTSTHNSR